MKKIIITILAASGAIATFAKTISVSKDAAYKADYALVQQALDSAKAGDVIYVYPGIYTENLIIQGKQISLVGPGYFLGENPNTQTFTSPAQINGTVSIGMKSDGSIISGMDFENAITISKAQNVIIKRNKINTSLAITNSNAITIKQNNFLLSPTSTDCGNSKSITNTALTIDGSNSNISVLNNIISATGYDCHPSFAMIISANVLLKNNAISGGGSINNSTLINNILFGGGFSLAVAGCSLQNNIAYNSVFGLTNGNQSNILVSTIFVGSTGNSTDGQYKIIAGGPAYQTGINGEDCGIFGGSDPYVLSGMPDIPSITLLKAPDAACSTLPVQIKIQSHK